MKFLNVIKNASTKVKSVAVSSGVVVGTFAVSTVAKADTTGATLDPNIANGFTTAGSQIGLIIGAAVIACVSVIALASGAKVGLKWIKGLFAKAN